MEEWFSSLVVVVVMFIRNVTVLLEVAHWCVYRRWWVYWR